MVTAKDELSPRPYPDAPPAFVIRAALRLRRWLQALADRLVPAEVIVFERSTGIAGTMALGAVARLGIADLLADGPQSAEQLAARTQVNADALHRTLRALATMGLFALHPDGRFANNARSEVLRSGRLSRSRAWATYFASAANVAAWADFDRVLTSGDNAFGRVHGESVWTYFDHHPDEREGFAEAMMGLTIGDAPVVASVYPFGEIRRLCDVGGGRGTLLSELLIRHPHLQGVLCDGAGVLESARRLLAQRGLTGQVELVPGSFFEAVPAGCDAYLLKHVLHDWDDPTCGRILATCRRAMQPGQRLLLVETLTERNVAAGFGPLADLQMMVVCDNGRERGRAEFATLMAQSGFQLTRVFETPTVSVLEGRAG